MYLTSPSFINNELLPKQYTCDAAGLHPPLQISSAPAETKSFALTVLDPDAPAGTWTHWLVWNIKPDTTLIATGEIPSGAVEGNNSSGQVGWYPPCPPSGVHRYIFSLYALDAALSLVAGASREQLEESLQNHILATATLTSHYER